MTWSPWQKQKNSQMDAQKMHDSDYQVSMSSLNVKTK